MENKKGAEERIRSHYPTLVLQEEVVPADEKHI